MKIFTLPPVQEAYLSICASAAVSVSNLFWTVLYWFASSMSGRRRSNESDPGELRKVVKLLLPEPPSASVLSLCSDTVVSEFEELLKEMLLLSSRPTGQWVQLACQMVWQKAEKDFCKRFGSCMATACQHLFQKARTCSTGQKLSPACRRLVKVINCSSRPLTMGDKFIRHLRKVLWYLFVCLFECF